MKFTPSIAVKAPSYLQQRYWPAPVRKRSAPRWLCSWLQLASCFQKNLHFKFWYAVAHGVVFFWKTLSFLCRSNNSLYQPTNLAKSFFCCETTIILVEASYSGCSGSEKKMVCTTLNQRGSPDGSYMQFEKAKTKYICKDMLSGVKWSQEERVKVDHSTKNSTKMKRSLIFSDLIQFKWSRWNCEKKIPKLRGFLKLWTIK